MQLAGSTTIPDLNHRDFYSITFFLPDIKEQQRIVSCLQGIDSKILDEEGYKQKLLALKHGLVEGLLSGKVRVNHLIKQ